MTSWLSFAKDMGFGYGCNQETGMYSAVYYLSGCVLAVTLGP